MCAGFAATKAVHPNVAFILNFGSAVIASFGVSIYPYVAEWMKYTHLDMNRQPMEWSSEMTSLPFPIQFLSTLKQECSGR
jgi:hypothetical protein